MFAVKGLKNTLYYTRNYAVQYRYNMNGKINGASTPPHQWRKHGRKGFALQINYIISLLLKF